MKSNHKCKEEDQFASPTAPGMLCDKSLKTASCPVCNENHVHYAFSRGTTRVLQCPDCLFTFRSVATKSVLTATDEANRLIGRIGGIDIILNQSVPDSKCRHLVHIVDWQQQENSFIEELHDVANTSEPPHLFLSVGQLDNLNAPLESLTDLREALAVINSKIIFVYSDIRRSDAEMGSNQWERQIGERNAYLDTHTALTLLYRAGFRCLNVRRLRRRIALEELMKAEDHYVGCNSYRRTLLGLLPASIRRTIHVNSRMAEVAILAEPRNKARPLVSVIIPVFNEAATVAKVLDTVLRVCFEGADVEIIIVESNSTDGSKGIVEKYAKHPQVTCIFEDRPRGKGHATRIGISQSKGDILIIQDADLEYDIEDYHALIDPIIRGHESFVLGSRHGGRNHWKLRQFSKPLLAHFYNLAHVFVTSYINLLFGLNLRDPQTMFKVFRRDCIEGLVFHGNYFNFDYELLLKIVRKGYRPIEVPVNYRSRSHAEGKKIRMWRDAPLGLWMITRLRLTPLRSFYSVGEPVE